MTVTDGGPWRGPTEAEWVARIASLSTPVRELVDGKFERWINPFRVPAEASTADRAIPLRGRVGSDASAGLRERSQPTESRRGRAE